MRLLIKIFPQKRTKIFFPYYLQIQGFIYNLLRGAAFEDIHNKNSYKFFCFSNIFSDSSTKSEFFEQKKPYNLIISSPNKCFLKTLAQKLLEKEIIKIHNANFSLQEIKLFASPPSFTKNFKITTASPIIIRIPQERYQDYDVSLKILYPYLFWRPKYPLEAFIKQLEDNIFKKYREYFQKEIKEFPIFQKFFFKKSVSIPLKIHGKTIPFIGSLWEFHFDYIDAQLKKLLEFALDCGFGESNSKGFGFVNVKFDCNK